MNPAINTSIHWLTQLKNNHEYENGLNLMIYTHGIFYVGETFSTLNIPWI